MTSPTIGPASRSSARGSMAGHGAEGTTASLAAVDEFPAALRLHAMFIEAADSHRLNQHLMRWALLCTILFAAAVLRTDSNDFMLSWFGCQCRLHWPGFNRHRIHDVHPLPEPVHLCHPGCCLQLAYTLLYFASQNVSDLLLPICSSLASFRPFVTNE